MKRITYFILLVLSFYQASAITIETYNDGLGNISWSTDGGATSCGCLPADGDNIIVNHVITLAGDFILETGSLLINNGGVLDINPGDLEIGQGGFGGSASLIVKAGGILNVTDDLRTWRNEFIVETGGEVHVGDDYENGVLMDPVINGLLEIGGDLTNHGIIVLQGDITGNGEITVAGTVTNNGSIGGSTGDDLGTLPVELIYFEGEVNENAVLLEWATASEENFDHFTVERSADGEYFEVIGMVEGHGSSSYVLYYEFTDDLPLQGTGYYRLTATDIDGFTENHGVISVQNDGSDFVIYPNPGNGQVMHISNKIVSGNLMKVCVYDLSGRMVHQQTIGSGSTEIIFDRLLDRGNYMVEMRLGDGASSRQVFMVR